MKLSDTVISVITVDQQCPYGLTGDDCEKDVNECEDAN